ncbi:MAG: hypothetical protein KJO26_01170 [Deltaproteobacteria bacterium]|nr:hypothetical protein [Deltaproteobacteria bacterium]
MKAAVITSYFAGETYGLLGPQMAATVIRENTPYECIVIAVSRDDDKTLLKKALADYFQKDRPVIGFSTLSGRNDLFSFARELKDEGAITILAGPQAEVDYLGEKNWQNHSHRFQGLSDNFSIALHGPAEQAIALFKNLDKEKWLESPGLLYLDENQKIIHNPKINWDEKYLSRVTWDNIYKLEQTTLAPHIITTGQVLQQIGCPYAARNKTIEIDYPAFMNHNKILLHSKGCSFCDVAVDKGFYGAMGTNTVINQILCLPESVDGRKIPLELINENPLPDLLDLLGQVKSKGIDLSQINLTMRADWLIMGKRYLIEALEFIKNMEIRIILTSIGFESFDDTILHNLNKGVNLQVNLKAIDLIRQLKDEFPSHFGYLRNEGGNHGFIHPTPWDSQKTSVNIQKIIDGYALAADILPDHSTPLIIHHASVLGDWIRKIEKNEGVLFKRYDSIIGWWEEALIAEESRL